jgi:hypothetical protein
VVDASLEMAFGLLGRYSECWDAAAWRVLVQRVVRNMLSLPPGLSPPAPQAALDSLSGQVPGWRASGTSRLAVSSGTGFGSPVGDSSPARGSLDMGTPAAAGAAAGAKPTAGAAVQQLAGPSGVLQLAAAGGAGGAVPVGMSAAEQGMLMTAMLQRMDRYYPLLCDQAALVRPEYKVGGWVAVARCGQPATGASLVVYTHTQHSQ